MLYFSRWKALATLLTALFVCLFAVPNFLPEETLQVAAEVGAAPCRARARPAGRLAHPARGRHQRRAQAEGRVAARRRAQLAAQRARRLHRAGDPRSDGRGAHPRGERFPGGADQAARTVAAARRPPERDRAALGRRGRRRQPRDPAHHHAAGDHRAGAPGGRAGDPDRRAPHQRDRHGRAADPAPGRRTASWCRCRASTIRRASSICSGAPRS